MSTTTKLRTTTMKPPLISRRHYSSSSRVYPAAVTLDASSKKRRYADISDSSMEDRNSKKPTLNNSSLRTLEHTDQRQRQRHPLKAGSGDGDKVRRVDSMEKKKNIAKSSEDVRIRAPGQPTKKHTKDDDSRSVLIQPEERVKLVQVERLGGLKKFRTLGHNERHPFKAGGDGDKFRRVHVDSMEKKNKITKSEDVRTRAPVQHTKTDTKDDDSHRVLIQPEKRVKLVRVEVERLGGLKFRFRFSRNIHNRNLSGDDAAAVGVMKNLAVPKPTEPNCSAARVKKSGLQETAEPDHCATAVVKKPETPEREHCWRLWRQIKLKREREAARRKIESMTKTVDIPNNYYDIMGELDRMLGDRKWVMEAFYGARNEKPLEKLGLFLKE